MKEEDAFGHWKSSELKERMGLRGEGLKFG